MDDVSEGGGVWWCVVCGVWSRNAYLGDPDRRWDEGSAHLPVSMDIVSSRTSRQDHRDGEKGGGEGGRERLATYLCFGRVLSNIY